MDRQQQSPCKTDSVKCECSKSNSITANNCSASDDKAKLELNPTSASASSGKCNCPESCPCGGRCSGLSALQCGPACSCNNCCKL